MLRLYGSFSCKDNPTMSNHVSITKANNEIPKGIKLPTIAGIIKTRKTIQDGRVAKKEILYLIIFSMIVISKS